MHQMVAVAGLITGRAAAYRPVCSGMLTDLCARRRVPVGTARYHRVAFRGNLREFRSSMLPQLQVVRARGMNQRLHTIERSPCNQLCWLTTACIVGRHVSNCCTCSQTNALCNLGRPYVLLYALHEPCIRVLQVIGKSRRIHCQNGLWL